MLNAYARETIALAKNGSLAPRGIRVQASIFAGIGFVATARQLREIAKRHRDAKSNKTVKGSNGEFTKAEGRG